ncbi:MAG: AEC family transporter [Dorea sp.]
MSFMEEMIHLQITFFLLIVVGIVLKWKGVINEQGQKLLSNITVNLLLPCNIIKSFAEGIEISGDFVRNCAYAFLISMIIQLFSIYIGKYLFSGMQPKKRAIFTYGLIVANSSCIGLPIMDVLYGNIGVMYTSFFQIPVRITMWTSGLALFTNVDKKGAYTKALRHPCIAAMGIGIVLMILPVKLPVSVMDTLAHISDCLVPISMIAIGAMLKGSKMKELFDKSILYYCSIRLLIYPLLIMAVLRLLQLDEVLINVLVILTGTPMATTTAILADKYESDSKLASQTILVSTILSIFTLTLLSAM